MDYGSSGEEIDPSEFFGATSPKVKPKAKAKAAPKSKAAAKSDATSSAARPSGQPVALTEFGFPANELPTVAPKKFNYGMVNRSAGGSSDIPASVMPDGAPNCLEGLKFVVTGEFSDLTREQITDLIKSFGGQITSAVSGKTSYLVVGNDPGSSKVNKAKSLKTRCLYESNLMDMIRSTKPDAGSSVPETEPEPEPGNEPESEPELVITDEPVVKDEPVAKSKVKSAETQDRPAEAISKPASKQQSEVKTEPVSRPVPKPAPVSASSASSALAAAAQKTASTASQAQSQLWTEKYKPTKLKELCGHKTQAQEIMKWLSWWASGGIPEKRSVLISGPPGIGKTTTAHLAAKLSGFDVFELNASETRSKNTLKSMLGAAVSNRSVFEFDRKALNKLETEQEQENDRDVTEFATTSGAKKLVIIMDEVDGMSGGDRGGSAELIQLIKRSRVPIICICNDRMSPKVRSLANYCEDLRFRRPTEQQMRARLNTIAFREGLSIEANAIGQLVKSTHNDIRQVINLMSSYSLNKGSMNYLESKAFSTLNRKEVAIGPFDVIGKYMNGMENASMSFADKLDLYYNDFSITPLFVQENYIDNKPSAASDTCESLEALSKAADLIAEADIVDNKLRGSQQWGLMPLHAALSCVGPAYHVRGSHNGMYRFPLWLGQNSKGSKLSRYLKDVQSHMRLRVSADKTEIRKSYIPAMVPELIKPLADQGASGIPDVIAIMDHYYLSKDHWDAMIELHLDGEQMIKRIPTAVKSAFTREYKKVNHPVAFSGHAAGASAKAVQAASSASLRPDTEDYIDDDDDGLADDDDADDDGSQSGDTLENDDLIATKKPKASAKPKPSAKAKRGTADSASTPRKRKKT
ncbi:DNA replication factor C complex subunit Rfc1 [Coemansia erecta]|uniref:Replication factor C subunit 1 n=1 Tax=Coemansia erecta TaxID=147472 RepID=A0A9W7Y0X1_9FUNG|nr:DNA replication factor C complex subunit Rfc1 [Coemansia erecta]